MSKPHLYINSKGYYVTRHSYSGSESFNYCARKYYLERVQGWQQREQRSSTAFGIALEHAITFWHQRGQNTGESVAEFVRLWAESKDKDLTYTKSDLEWDRLNLTGQEFVRLYALLYPNLPYTVKDPDTAFQVERSVEVFPDSKLQGITFVAYLDLTAVLKATGEDMVVDMKTSGKKIPDLTELDPQLRSYAWITGWSNVAFLNFCKMGRTISRGDAVTLLGDIEAGMKAGAEATILAPDSFGWYITADENVLIGLKQFEGKSKAVEAAREAYVRQNGIFVQEKHITKQRIYFQQAVISASSMEDIGRAIKRDVVNISRATEMDFFPMQSGIRFPNEKCPNCAMRGICADRPELRDILLTRKQEDELYFAKTEEA